MIERWFKLAELRTDVRTEVLAGVTGRRASGKKKVECPLFRPYSVPYTASGPSAALPQSCPRRTS